METFIYIIFKLENKNNNQRRDKNKIPSFFTTFLIYLILFNVRGHIMYKIANKPAWKIIMKKWIFLLTIPFILTTNTAYAEKLASILEGKVMCQNISEIQVLVTENDGSILDMTNLSAAGVYKLDLTIMDTPSQSEVNKLILEVKNKAGTKTKYQVKQYLKVFDDTVLLRPVVFD